MLCEARVEVRNWKRRARYLLDGVTSVKEADEFFWGEHLSVYMENGQQ
jgi:hypothetical protein